MEQLIQLKAQAYDQFRMATNWNNALIATQKDIEALEAKLRQEQQQASIPQAGLEATEASLPQTGQEIPHEENS